MSRTQQIRETIADLLSGFDNVGSSEGREKARSKNESKTPARAAAEYQRNQQLN